MYYFNIPALISVKFSENILYGKLLDQCIGIFLNKFIKGQKNSFEGLEQFFVQNHGNLTRELYSDLSVTHLEKL